MEKLFIGTLKCADCGHVLNTTKPVTQREKTMCIISSVFNAGKCPKGCRSTYSDCNANTDLDWTEALDETN